MSDMTPQYFASRVILRRLCCDRYNLQNICGAEKTEHENTVP